MVVDKKGVARLAAEVHIHLEEMNQVIRELSSYRLSDDVKDPLVLRACGSILHDVYTGAEAIFQIIAEEIDGSRPTSSDWHRRLLMQMSVELSGIRPKVLSESIIEQLDEYRAFRHIFRNVYGRRLYWQRMKPLVDDLPSLIERLHKEFTQFLDVLRAICGG